MNGLKEGIWSSSVDLKRAAGGYSGRKVTRRKASEVRLMLDWREIPGGREALMRRLRGEVEIRIEREVGGPLLEKLISSWMVSLLTSCTWERVRSRICWLEVEGGIPEMM